MSHHFIAQPQQLVYWTIKSAFKSHPLVQRAGKAWPLGDGNTVMAPSLRLQCYRFPRIWVLAVAVFWGFCTGLRLATGQP